MRKMQSFFNLLQISLASPIFIVSSQLLQFLALIRVSFSCDSFFHCLQAALNLLLPQSPMLLRVLARESLYFLFTLDLFASSSRSCRKMKSETVVSFFRQVGTLLSTDQRFTNSTFYLARRFSSSDVAEKPTSYSMSRNYSRVRHKRLVFQKVSRSMLFSPTNSSNLPSN